MFFRQLLISVAVPVIFLASALAAFAAKSHDGKVVSVSEGSGATDGKLVMTDKQGKGEHSHAISSSVKITRNNKTAKLGDLKKGDLITVTTADDGKVTEVAASDTTSADRSTTSSSDSSSALAHKSEIPDILKNLNLSSDQQSKIKDIVSKYDSDCETAWKEFSDRYQEAIRMEASMMVAIEDHFSDGQRKHLREQRRKAARHHSHRNGKVDVKIGGNATDNSAQEELVIVGISLTPQQQESVQRVRNGYLDRLGRLNEEIDQLHSQMISLETEKLLDIENVLTQEQRKQLREDHQKLSRQSDETSDKSSTK